MPRVETGAELPQQPAEVEPHVHHDGDQFVKGFRAKRFKSPEAERRYRHLDLMKRAKQTRSRRANRKLTRALHQLERSGA